MLLVPAGVLKYNEIVDWCIVDIELKYDIEFVFVILEPFIIL